MRAKETDFDVISLSIYESQLGDDENDNCTVFFPTVG